MGIFGPSLTEKIRRSAAAALPQAEWTIDVDWSSGEKLHRLQGALAQASTEADAMQSARDVWKTLVGQYRLDPNDGRDGLLDVCVSAPGIAGQSTGTAG